MYFMTTRASSRLWFTVVRRSGVVNHPCRPRWNIHPQNRFSTTPTNNTGASSSSNVGSGTSQPVGGKIPAAPTTKPEGAAPTLPRGVWRKLLHLLPHPMLYTSLHLHPYLVLDSPWIIRQCVVRYHGYHFSSRLWLVLHWSPTIRSNGKDVSRMPWAKLFPVSRMVGHRILSYMPNANLYQPSTVGSQSLIALMRVSWSLLYFTYFIPTCKTTRTRTHTHMERSILD